MKEKESIKKSLSDKLTPVLVLIVFLLVFGFGMLWQKVNQLEKAPAQTTTTGTQNNAQAPAAVAVTQDQIKKLFDKPNALKFGNENSKLLLVEVADPSCPYCSIAAGHNSELNNQAGANFKLVKDGGTYVAPVIEMKKLVDSGKAAYIYIYTPGHGNGEMGTKALYCANEKGKFWPVHDLLMSSEGYDLLNNDVKNDKAKSQTLATFLKSAVDSNFMKSCLDSDKYAQTLTDDIAIASSLGVQGTPGFFVNTTNFAGAYSFKDMEAAVNSAL